MKIKVILCVGKKNGQDKLKGKQKEMGFAFFTYDSITEGFKLIWIVLYLFITR